MARRLRVIYADLSEFIGTTAEWDQVRDGILIIQIEEPPGHWVALHGHDWYYVVGDDAGAYTSEDNWDLAIGSSTIISRRLSRQERAGKLVDNDVWESAKAMMREPAAASR